jgi:hypothetical protein
MNTLSHLPNDSIAHRCKAYSTAQTETRLLPFFEKKKKEGAYEITLLILCPTSDVARQRFGKHVPAATNTLATIGKLLDAVFSMRFVLYQIICSETKNNKTQNKLRGFSQQTNYTDRTIATCRRG